MKKISLSTLVFYFFIALAIVSLLMLIFIHNDTVFPLSIIGLFLGTFGIFFSDSLGGLKKIQVEKEYSENLKKTGQHANATVIKVEDEHQVLAHTSYLVTLTLDVKPEGKESFQATLKTYISPVYMPKQGDTIEVFYDPSNKTDIHLLKQ